MGTPTTTHTLTSSQHHAANTAFIQDIIDQSLPSSPPALSSFIEQLYAHVPLTELSEGNAKSWQHIAKELFAFIQSRTLGQPALRLYTPKGEAETRYSIIEILNDDMPFLVDSIMAELNRQGIKIYQIIHPVLKVRRDEEGMLLELLKNDEEKPGIARESVMHLQISRITDEALFNTLENSLKEVLSNVRMAVKDWHPTLERLQETAASYTSQNAVLEGVDYDEVRDFLTWLGNDNFVFLGSISTIFNEKGDVSVVAGSELGIVKNNDPIFRPEGKLPAKTTQLVEVGKLNRLSTIHRPVYLDYIAIRVVDKEGRILKEQRFFGLFTSSVYYQSATLIPIIHKKIQSVLKRSGFAPASYSHKELISIIEAFPRDELLQMSEDELFDTCMNIYALYIRPRTQLFARRDNSGRFISCIVFIPRERFSASLSEKIQNILQEHFTGTVANHYIQVSDTRLARLHVIINTGTSPDTALDLATIEAELEKISSEWSDGLRSSLVKTLGENEGERLFYSFRDAFSAAYKDRFPAETAALRDVQKTEEALRTNRLVFDLYRMETDRDTLFHLKIYSPENQLLLSDIMPVLENMGFSAIDEHSFQIVRNEQPSTVWIQHFQLTPSASSSPELNDIKTLVEDALSAIWAKSIQNDGFNKLIVLAALSWRQVVVLRACAKYLRQTGFTYSQSYMEDVLAKHPLLSHKIVELFHARFDPAQAEAREETVTFISRTIEEALMQVVSSAEDRVIRRFYDLIMAMLRTNYFQTDSNNQHKPYVSFKFDSSRVPDLPLPRPYAEIFVYSARVEGIHLRGGKVARGGLRWSDRSEDFRTEVLGLMKAQMAKNSVIVPVGSKGGFVVKQVTPDQGRDLFMQEGIECYKTFLRGLLDITDNIIDGKIIPPSQVVRQDGDDPYLVVAADKGTATFSDIANSISKEYNFWLGDAFASGGSAGYDHKKMGITARGAWISVERHFREQGIDTRTTDFSVIGIGDMSGDVFGNGMLLSPHIKLVAAFNHMHIFLDPNPNSAASFEERKRLFNLPRSSWTDYNQELISAGGGVFERKAKSIPLSAEVQQCLGVTQDAATPEALIQLILKAPVDLLWNGGIGTYVKAMDETNEDVGDKANDAIRINGDELRAKVVGEGGNLGFTQRGRIEYARLGGRINTDAIDNSAGVDCSDHEVNIKIALGQAIENGTLQDAERNSLLEQMTDEVAALVLRDNTLQTQALTIAQMQGNNLLEMQQRLMHILEQAHVLDPRIEFLPTDAEISRRIVAKEGLARPELAVLLAYSKLAIYSDLLDSSLPDEPYFYNDLLLYFPVAMRERFAEAIASHPLRREIIATFVTNSMVNRVGSTFFHLTRADTGLKGCDIARAYTITRDAFDLRSIWVAIENLDGQVSAETQVKLFLEVDKLIHRATFWFLRNSPQPLDVERIVGAFAPAIGELSSCISRLLLGTAKETYNEKRQSFISQNVPEALANQIAALEALASACDIVQVAKGDKLPVATVAAVYFELGTRFRFGWLRSRTNKLTPETYWQRLSIDTIRDDLYDQQMRLTADVMKHAATQDDPLAYWCKQNTKQIERYDSFITDLKSYETVDFSMVVVAAKRIGSLLSV